MSYSKKKKIPIPDLVRIITFPLGFIKNPKHFISLISKIIYQFNIDYDHSNLINNETLIEKLISGEINSFMRWGDGDSLSAFGEAHDFEHSNVDLQNELIDILINYNISSTYTLLFPIRAIEKSVTSLILKNEFTTWYRTRYLYKRYLFKDKIKLSDSFIFKKESDFDVAQFINYLIKFNIIYIGNTVPELFLEYTFEREFSHVLIPLKYSYSFKSEIIEQIRDKLSLNHEKDTKLLFSAGNLSRILIDQFSFEGYSCYDIGNPSV